MVRQWLRHLVTISVLLALFVVMLGAYTRLTNAGLGCPDWPGCYGHLVLPTATETLDLAQEQYPHSLIETRKAWTEMAHRYAAGSLALCLFIISGYLLWQQGKKRITGYRFISVGLILLVCFQAALGMWTVTLKLLPIVVMGHLLGGIIIFSTLCRLRLQLSIAAMPQLSLMRLWIALGVVILLCQIALGGWVSANYAGLACVGFPQCNGQWIPDLQLSAGFNLLSPVGDNYQGGVLDNNVRATIQYIHRVGAVVTALYIILLSVGLLVKQINKPLRMAAWIAICLVTTQFILGIMNVLYLLPLHVAVAHNGVAALLMATMVSMFYLVGRHRYGN